MATKKDFSKMNTNPVYESIAEATAEPEVYEAQEEHEEQEERSAASRKKGRAYTDTERQTYRQTGKTQGRQGCKMERINMAFTSDNYDYVKIMSSVRGQTMTEFVNHIISKSLEENAALFAQAKAFKKAF